MIMLRSSVFTHWEYRRLQSTGEECHARRNSTRLALLQDKFTIKTEEFAIVALAYADFVGRVTAVPGASVIEECRKPQPHLPSRNRCHDRGDVQAPDVVTPSRPVAGFRRDIVPSPRLLAVPPGESVSTQMPRARVVQGNQPTVGNLKPAFETEARTAAYAEPARQGFRPPPKDVAEKPGLIEAETGPREYVKKEYLGDVGPAGRATVTLPRECPARQRRG